MSACFPYLLPKLYDQNFELLDLDSSGVLENLKVTRCSFAKAGFTFLNPLLPLDKKKQEASVLNCDLWSCLDLKRAGSFRIWRN